MPKTTDRVSENRSERFDDICQYCDDSLPDKSRPNRKYCNNHCRRLAFEERASEGRVASVRRLKSGKMSVVVHIADAGLRPGNAVKVGLID